MKCPKCKDEMVSGYSCASAPLSWINPEKFRSFIFKDEDLARAGLKALFPWKGYYFKSFNCPGCKIILVDYSQKYDRKTIKSRQTV